MDTNLGQDTKKKWLWGMTFAWIPFIPTIIGISTPLRESPRTKQLASQQ